ncbi:hypothetical protein SAMN04487967_2664 [Natronorubrum sediminis]|uniref:UPF0215 protein SAMN04487967_2664 n=1 Tax=Natronorubrum sediminis TaxID=640943 RepID=A0A1H6G3M7_9EURY|nr:DUF99 family protein [Natronorubrum sediminis]SEH16495.1 hypothetical protein SAMN04487967_2664 [Natronorubrum sediminis]
MKPGVRALGIAESVGPSDERSTLAGVVVRRDRVVEDAAFRSCAVGGTDATDAVCSLLEECVRPDVQYVLVGSVAPAWYNLLDLAHIHQRADRPVIAVTFEESDGLEAGLRDAFSGASLEDRLERYRALPPRRSVSVTDETVYVRHLGCDASDAATVVRAFTPEGGRPEPIRVASALARAGNQYAGRRSRLEE